VLTGSVRFARPLHLRTISLSRLGQVTIAEAIVVGVMAALVALVWHIAI